MGTHFSLVYLNLPCCIKYLSTYVRELRAKSCFCLSGLWHEKEKEEKVCLLAAQKCKEDGYGL